jgi:hypothetical protein
LASSSKLHELTPVPDLKSPAASDEKRVAEIGEISLAWWLKKVIALGAQEGH